MNRNQFAPLGDNLTENTDGNKATARITMRIDRTVLEAAKRAHMRSGPLDHKPRWWLNRWCELGAMADGVVLYDVDHTGPAEVLQQGDEWTACTVLARGPEHVTVGVNGAVRTVAPELVRRVEG